jgi:hypothetical protein
LKKLILSFIFVLIFFINVQYVQANEIKVNGKAVSGELDRFDYPDYNLVLAKKTKIEINLNVSTISEGLKYGEIKLEVEEAYEEETKYGTTIRGVRTKFEKNIKFWGSESFNKSLILPEGNYYIRINSPSREDVKFNLAIIDVSEAPTKIEVPSELTVKVGSPKKIKVTVVSPKSAIETGIKWESSDTKIATVSSNGKVSAKAEGNCIITAKLKNNKVFKCKITVPKPTLEQQLMISPVYVKVTSVYDRSIYNNCYVDIINNSKKTVTYIEMNILQYDNRGYILKSPYTDYIYDETLESSETDNVSYWVNEYTKKARVCVKKVWYSDGSTWSNPLYQTWLKKYQNKNY